MIWYELENASEVPSPSLLVYPERVQQNLVRMCEIAGDPARLRPHVKTHKLAPIVQMSLELGIARFKCATLAEAEMLAKTGAPDVLFAYQPVGPNVTRLLRLAAAFPDTRFSCLLDDEEAAVLLSTACAEANQVLGVWLDIDVGMGRTGVADADEAQALYALLMELPGLFVRGLHAYDGHIHARDPGERSQEARAALAKLADLAQDLKRSGFTVEERIIGGSPTFVSHAREPGLQLSPGTTVLWDQGYATQHPDLEFLPAALVLTRVISKPTENRLCLDLGHKAIGAEMPQPRVHFFGLEDVTFVSHSEEHLVIETARASELGVGAVLYGIPWHTCSTVALYDRAVVVRDNRASEAWPITARGRSVTSDQL